MNNQARGGEPTDELRLVLRVFLGAGQTLAREWVVRGRTTREQAETLLLGTLRAMAFDVLPALSPTATGRAQASGRRPGSRRQPRGR